VHGKLGSAPLDHNTEFQSYAISFARAEARSQGVTHYGS
jgi:hypothetical protein